MQNFTILRNIYDSSGLQRLLAKTPYIIAATVAGLISVAFGRVIDFMTDLSTGWLVQIPYLFLVLTPLSFVAARWIVQVLGLPAAGSGIPQVMASLHSQARAWAGIDRLLSFRVLLAKILSCSVCLLGGGLVGREGPMVQISAIVFLGVGRRLRKFIPKIDDYSLIVAGGAAGVAAAFNTPLGGIVFAIEELIDQHFGKVKSALIVGVIIAGMVAQSIVGPYLYLGTVKLETPGISFLVPMFTISLLLGILGGFFGKTLIKIQLKIGGWAPVRRLQWACFCGVLVAIGLILMKNEASYAVGGGTKLIRDILWDSQSVDPGLLLQRYTGSLFSFLSGCAGGIFAPSLAFGAAFGKATEVLFNGYDPVALTLIGMASFLAAVTRAPFTSMVLVTEMSDCHSIALFVLLASLIAVGIAKVVEPISYYHFQSEMYLNQIMPRQNIDQSSEPVSQHF